MIQMNRMLIFFYLSIRIVCKIPCLDCNGIYIGQSGIRPRVSINEHSSACKSHDLRLKKIQHSVNLDHRPNLSNPIVLVKNCTNIAKRIFSEAFFTRSFKFTFNEAACVPSEYAVLIYFLNFLLATLKFPVLVCLTSFSI